MIFKTLRKISSKVLGYPKTKQVKSPLLKFPELVNSYSQYGEDLIVDSILNDVQDGFFVDVGANHPKHFSNTYRFYKKGWKGINIEPQPLLFNQFIQERPRDINLNLGVSSTQAKLRFYELDSHTLSTFDYDLALKNGKRFNSSICKEYMVDVQPLSQILRNNLPPAIVINFLSIDTEGFDLAVLKSNDWKTYRPRVIIIELGDVADEIDKYLTSLNYSLVYLNGTNGIYYRKEN